MYVVQVLDFGITVRDKVTGMEGIVTGHAQYVTGSDSYLVRPKVKPDGDPVDVTWFDGVRLEVDESVPQITLVELDPNRERRYEFGVWVKDQITGFTGVVTGFVRYISGCDQYVVQPVVDPDGKFVDGHWFDEARLLPYGLTKIVLEDPQAAASSREKGADGPAPLR